jgi:restriction system protein
MNTWMVRAGRHSRLFEQFRQDGVVAIGWRGVGDVTNVATKNDFFERVAKAYPNYREQQIVMATSQLYRFAREFKTGDRVVTYDSGGRKYLCGIITGEYQFSTKATEEEFENLRSVNWTHETSRDQLSSKSKNSLGAISTIFQIPEFASRELWMTETSERHDETGVVSTTNQNEVGEVLDLTFLGISETASEKIKDRLTGLDGNEMELLVAGMLRAMGYQTRVSPRGPDRGADIVASPDGFGFQEPRIVVEVKHRPGQRMGAPEIRSFLGGRHQRDKGLYVSTGGFTNEARYEADRAAIPLTTWDFEELTETLLRYYEKLDQETRQLIPLKAFYWPID